MNDAMLWTIIGAFVATMALLLTLIGWFLVRIEKGFERVDMRLDRMETEQRKTHDDVTQIKASLASIGERLTRGGI